MDTVTQALLGATVARAAVGERLGARARAWGAAAGVLPDVDMAFLALGDPLAEFRHHRGVTHSVLFAPLVAPVLAALVLRGERARGRGGSYADWLRVMFLALFTHPLLDVFTSYGTQLLWPLSRHRFAVDAVAILDPFYTVMLLPAALLSGDVAGRGRRWAAAGVAASTLYLGYGAWLNGRAEAQAAADLRSRGIEARVRAYPTLLQPWVRRVVARSGDRVHVGHVSTLSGGRAPWAAFTEPADPRIDAVRATADGALFEWFAAGQTTGRVVEGGRAVEVEDLRYGGPAGPPDHGLWGIRMSLGPDGQPAGRAARFNRRPAPGPSLRALREAL